MIQTLAIANYRSLRQLVVPLGRLNLEEELGETRIVGQGILVQPPWHWPER